MTATLTSTAQAYDDGARTYCVDLRASTVAAGVLWLAAAAWIYVSDGAGTVTRRHHGLELVHCSTVNGERFDGIVVDEDGTAEFTATPVTTVVNSTFAATLYVDADSGNDANPGTSGSPKLTLTGASGAFASIRSGWSAGAEHRVFLQGTTSIASPANGVVWNANSAADGSGAELLGRLHILQWPGETTGQISITTDDGFALLNDDQALHCGVTVQGSYTLGGAAVTATGIVTNVVATGGDGHNVTLKDCTFGGFYFGFVSSAGAVSITEMGNGSFDWIAFDDVIFSACYGTNIYLEATRYLGFADCTWQGLQGAGTGASLRFAQASYMSVTDCTFDRTASSGWRGNVFRLNGGFGADGTWDRTQFVSLSNVLFQNTTECVEIEMVVTTSDRYLADAWFHNVRWDAAAGNTGHMFTITGSSWDLLRTRITNCSGRAEGLPGATYFCRISQSASGTTATVKSLRLDQNTWYQEQSQGFFTRDAVLLSAGGHADNYADDSIELLSNYAFCADTDANSPRCLFQVPSASAKIGAEDYNVLASAGTNTTTWNDGDSLATWVSGTVFGDHSFEITSASHNLTSVTAQSFNPEPAADGTPSASLPQVRRGFPGLGFTDADRYLRDVSLPDAGSHEYGTGTLMDDPEFGTEAFFSTFSRMDDGFRTIAAAGLNGVLL